MSVLLPRVVLVLQPLLQLAVLADLVRGDSRARVHERRAEVGVYVQQLRRGDAIRHQVADDLVVHCRTGDEAADLR